MGECETGLRAATIPFPARDANKYTRGKLVCVAGSATYPGAAVLAARAGQRMGAGYTEVVTARDAVDVVRLSSPSLVVRSFDGWRASDLPVFSSQKPCAVCVGPGFDSSDARSADLVVDVLASAKCPVVVDGGGLAAFAQKRVLRYLERRFADGLPTVVTPHGGEAARMAAAWGIESSEPAELVQKLACAFGCIAVLKGSVTYVSDCDELLVMDEGTPALAKAGTGDVLAGMIGALLAQGVDPLEAAWSGSLLHARAGRAAEEKFTQISVTAEDVVEAIEDIDRPAAEDVVEAIPDAIRMSTEDVESSESGEAR